MKKSTKIKLVWVLLYALVSLNYFNRDRSNPYDYIISIVFCVGIFLLYLLGRFVLSRIELIDNLNNKPETTKEKNMETIKFFRSLRVLMILWTAISCFSVFYDYRIISNLWFISNCLVVYAIFYFFFKNQDSNEFVYFEPLISLERILEIIILYKKVIKNYPDLEFQDSCQKFSEDKLKPNRSQNLGHCEWMLDQMEIGIESGVLQIEDANRLLGFIQGCLWSKGIYSTKEIYNHNFSS
ncbi:MAG: hypothetical protein NTX85_03695 [Candidatus Nomurabacteria bacterium]|nr:hypothetical protein [Candidatus Nomurabacteria bacterium]